MTNKGEYARAVLTPNLRGVNLRVHREQADRGMLTGAKIEISSICRWELMKSAKVSNQLNVEPGYLSRCVELFRYNIASCEMRFIERTERVIQLARQPGGAWSMRGAVPGCGQACDADLAMILLEFLLSCEGSLAGRGSGAEQSFCTKVVRSLVAQLERAFPDLSQRELLRATIECIARSLDEAGRVDQETDRVKLVFANCPLCRKARECGMQRSRDRAHDLYADMCQAAVAQLQPEVQTFVTFHHRGEDDGLGITIELART